MRLILAVVLGLACPSCWALSESEPNGASFLENGPFTIPATITGSLQNDGGFLADYFSFSTAAGQKWRLIASVTNLSNFFPMDNKLEVENGAVQRVGLANSFGANGTETLNFTAPSAGTFYLVVVESTQTANAVAGYSVAVLPQAAVSDWNLY